MDSSCHFSIMFLSQSHLLLLILCADSIYLVRCHYWTHGSALNTRQGAIQNFDTPPPSKHQSDHFTDTNYYVETQVLTPPSPSSVT